MPVPISLKSIWYMRAFFLAWTVDVQNLQQPVGELDGQSLPQPVSEIPWGHNIQIITKLKDPGERLWYAQQTIVHGWSRAVLVHQIESGLFERQGQAITNSQATLPPPQSDLAQQVLKDPYSFEFLTLAPEARERELERGLLAHLRRFLLELGAGFAFVGEQHHLEVGGEDFYLDLLFYHLRLRCYVVIELKMEPFRPEFAGKMNFNLSAVDDLLRHPDAQPSIGLILCRDKNRLVVEYALRDMRKPIGVSAYRITERLPVRLKGSLPTVEQIEKELGGASPSARTRQWRQGLLHRSAFQTSTIMPNPLPFGKTIFASFSLDVPGGVTDNQHVWQTGLGDRIAKPARMQGRQVRKGGVTWHVSPGPCTPENPQSRAATEMRCPGPGLQHPEERLCASVFRAGQPTVASVILAPDKPVCAAG